jgi:eukaryotic-like serine/threonine-protein kinase
MSAFKEKLKTSFGWNIALVLALCAVLYVLFFASLRCVTHHGQEVVVPDVRGKKMDSVVKYLQELGFEVLIDSTYEPTMRPLSVLKQVPDTGSYVKRGRAIFLTVNRVTAPMVAMPNIKDLSYRSAAMILRNNKLIVGDTTYRSDIASGAVLEASIKGTTVSAGSMVAQGSKVDLVIGNGLGNTEWNVPDVTGMTVDEAILMLNQYNLQPFIVSVDKMGDITDTPSAIIVNQSPKAFSPTGDHNRIKMGEFMDLQIMQHPSPEDIHQGPPGQYGE